MVNPGFNAGIAQEESWKRVGWALRGATQRKKDLRLSPLAAIAEGRKLRDRLSDTMSRYGLKPEDGAVFCVFAKSDLSDLSKTLEPINIEESAAELDVVKRHLNETPIGLLAVAINRTTRESIVSARPLLVDSRSLELNEQAAALAAELIRRRSEQAKAKRAAQK